MEMVVASILLSVGPKSSIGFLLGWDLVTVKALASYSHHFHTLQTIQWPLYLICFSTPLFRFFLICPLSLYTRNVFPDRKATEERSSSKKDKHSDVDAASIKASSEAEPMETEAAASASSPLVNGQLEILHSEGDTQSN